MFKKKNDQKEYSEIYLKFKEITLLNHSGYLLRCDNQSEEQPSKGHWRCYSDPFSCLNILLRSKNHSKAALLFYCFTELLFILEISKPV